VIDKTFLSLAAIALTFVAFVPYIVSINKGITKPHVFSWVIWGSTTFVVFLAQLEDNAGVGAWPIGVSGLITILIAHLAFKKRGDITITKKDWLFLFFAFSALPFWYFTSNPLWAVIILTAVDILGFGPTIRKVWYDPYSESALFISLFFMRNILVILALEHYSVITALFPAVIAFACLLLLLIIAAKRQTKST
jgi:hypothetical protein